MNETSKTKKIWSSLEASIVEGKRYRHRMWPRSDSAQMSVSVDITDGDANRITEFVHEQFDFVYSSHCLEHMREP